MTQSAVEQISLPAWIYTCSIHLWRSSRFEFNPFHILEKDECLGKKFSKNKGWIKQRLCSKKFKPKLSWHLLTVKVHRWCSVFWETLDFSFLELYSSELPAGPSHLWNLLEDSISLIDVFPSANLANSGVPLGTNLVTEAWIRTRLQWMHVVKQIRECCFNQVWYGWRSIDFLVLYCCCCWRSNNIEYRSVCFMQLLLFLLVLLSNFCV